MTKAFTQGDSVIHTASGVTVRVLDANGGIYSVRFPDGRLGVYPGTAFTSENIGGAFSQPIDLTATKAFSSEVDDGDTLREWLVNKTVALASLRTESDELKRCGISDCRKMILDVRAGEIEDELHTVAALMAKTTPTSAALRKGASSFSRGDRVKVAARHGEKSDRVGTVRNSNTNETVVEFGNGSMAIVKTFDVALA